MNKHNHTIQKHIDHKSDFQFFQLYFLIKREIVVTIGMNVKIINIANRFGIIRKGVNNYSQYMWFNYIYKSLF